MKKYIFLILFLIFSAYTHKSAKAENIDESPVRFAIIGDRTGGHIPKIYEQIVAEVERLKPDFVITVGDMIEGYTNDTTSIKQEWEEYKSLIKNLSMPIYFTPGNHDIWDNASLNLYQRYVGKPYYSFDFKDIHFIILDNSRWESNSKLPKGQIEWLIKDLTEHQNAKYTLVFYHKPFWSETLAEGESDTLHNIFTKFGVDAVFNGHHHIYYSEKFDNILYTCVGSSGAKAEEGPTGVLYHFTWVTVDKNGIFIAPIKMGSIIPWDEVTAKEIKFIDNLNIVGITFENIIPVNETKTSLFVDTTVVIKFNNLNSNSILEDTLRWEIPEGWSINPTTIPIRIMPAESYTAKFNIKNSGKLYPTPTLYIRFPYSENKQTKIANKLSVTRKAYCYKAKNNPTIDGKISESIWQNPISRFFRYDGTPAIIDSTYFYFSYNKNNLYISAYCKESEISSMTANVKERDGAVYTEDCVGYFLQPDTEKGDVYQIYFNPKGTVFDQKLIVNSLGKVTKGDINWNGIYEVKTNIGKDFWSIEAKIPLSQFNTDGKAGKNWRINFRRKQKRLNDTGDWQIPISYDPKTFGLLIMK